MIHFCDYKTYAFMKTCRTIYRQWIGLLLAFLACSFDVWAASFRCKYTGEDGSPMEMVLRDSFSVEKRGYVLSVFSKKVGAADSTLVFLRDSLHRSFSLSLAELPRKSCFAPKVVGLCGKQRLFFWMESCRTDVVLLNSHLSLVALSLDDGEVSIASVEGRRMDLAMKLHANSTERRFWKVRQEVLLVGDSCVTLGLKGRLLRADVLADETSVSMDNSLNYVVAWEALNGLVLLSELEQVRFAYFNRPFFPARPSRSVENEFYKVVAFPYGDVLAYDKRNNRYFVVWASRALPQDDYSAALSWRAGAPDELVMSGFYDREARCVNLCTGKITKE